MSTSFPTSQDPTVVPGSKLSSNPHSTLHIDDRDAIRALQAKLGIGTTAQAAIDRHMLVGTGAGASKWETAPSGLSFTSPTFVAADMNGTELILDADADTSFTADTDDQIDVKIAGADDFRYLANIFRALSGSSIETNTINETTSGNGVTIDGLSVKDSKLNTADSVIPSNLQTGAGSAWDWQTWSPTFSNFTVGNSTVTAYYIEVGKVVFYRIHVIIGSTGTMGTEPRFTLPVTAAAYPATSSAFAIIGDARLEDVGTGVHMGYVDLFSTTVGRFVSATANTASVSLGGITATAPFNWATNDIFQATGFYERD